MNQFRPIWGNYPQKIYSCLRTINARNLPGLVYILMAGLAFILLAGAGPLSLAARSETQSALAADSISLPLGYKDGLTYGPRITHNNNGALIEDTSYGVKNPDLKGITCFDVEFDQLYHAGADLYRVDASSTAGAEVTAVANGTVLFADPGMNYPGLVIIIEHLLPSNQKIYSMYAHLEHDSLAVRTGQTVSRGQLLGIVMHQDYTGRYPEYHPSGDDSHLHFEIRYFYNGRNIYPDSTNCNGLIPGRGYTYPERPDDFPAPGAGYLNPLTFIANAK